MVKIPSRELNVRKISEFLSRVPTFPGQNLAPVSRVFSFKSLTGLGF